jgi:ArsR family transcriptional regulator, cadmium/lead-responsive transcriptional repressor
MEMPMLISSNAQETAIKARLFRGLADSSRLGILETLRNGPQTVTEIVAATGLSQSNTSNHLSCLSDCGLVSRSQKGRNVIYQLSDARVGGLLVLAEQLLSDVARGVYECTRYREKEPV